MDQLAIKPQVLAEMIRLIEDTTISGKIAKDILPELLEGKGNAGVKVSIWCGEVWPSMKNLLDTCSLHHVHGCLGNRFADDQQ